jgi:mRNA interferase MazF
LASAGREDWILCQVTSNAYADVSAVEIADSDFLQGGLRRTSYARPGKLFTASRSLIVRQVGQLTQASFETIINATVNLLQSNLRP